MSVRWQTFNFKKLLTKYPIIPTAWHPLHSPHPIPGAASRRPPPWNTARQGQVDSVFLCYKAAIRVRCKKAAGNLDLVSCFIHEIQRTAEPNNHQDYSANQSGIQNYRLPFYLRTLRRFLLIKKQNLLVPACMSSTKRLPLNL